MKIETSPRFERELKNLANHYHSVKQDYKVFLESLKENPLQGTSLGKGIRKVRMTITDKGKGKSGGARVLTYTALLTENNGTLLLLTIYDKSNRSTMTDKEIRNLIKQCGI
ncbi:MAG: addiction module toxin RelE [Prevotella sp.]|nr:addiction module toxin RelE [Prevotella sp.]